jgi:hypothetical protein
MVFTGLMISFIFFLGIGDLRSNLLSTEGGRFSVSAVTPQKEASLVEIIQLYANDVQYGAFALERVPADSIGLAQVVNSLLSPLPLYNSFSSTPSSAIIFNGSVYSRGQVDLILSSVSEMYLFFGFPALSVFFILIGFLLRKSVNLLTGKDFYTQFVLGTCIFWLAFAPVFSVSVLSQIFFYNALPLAFVATIHVRNQTRSLNAAK